jgi:holo-[acyl-carrier protein] synthase
MIYGIGTDLCEVNRIKQSIEKYGEKFVKRVFTQTEIEYCDLYKDKKYVHYAARFAAKEAFSKAIGTGFTEGFKLNEVGIVNEVSGKPNIELFGSLKEKYSHLKVHISLSHTDDNAHAYLILESI